MSSLGHMGSGVKGGFRNCSRQMPALHAKSAANHDRTAPEHPKSHAQGMQIMQ